jgi:hypothetical protein
VSFGGIGHLTDCEYWCLTAQDGDGGRSIRESALAVWDFFADAGLLRP